MNNEKNFLLAIVLTITILLLYPLILKQFFPQALPPPSQEKILEHSPLLPAAPETKNVEQKSTTYYKEKSYVIENENYLITINYPNADIKSIELKKFINPKTKKPTVVTDTDDRWPGIFSISSPEAVTLKNVRLLDKEIIFEYTLGTDLELTKIIKLNDSLYQIKLELLFKNLSNQEETTAYTMTAIAAIKATSDLEKRTMEMISISPANKTYKKNIAGVRKDYAIVDKLKIVALKARYFSLVLVPSVTTDVITGYGKSPEDIAGSFLADVKIDRVKIPPAGSVEQTFVLYAGPNNFDEMSKLNQEVEQILGKGIFFGFSEFLLSLLRLLNNLFKNYGLAVIALSLIINLFLYPLTFRSLKSMKEMQLLQPAVEKLRQEHKDNAQKLNKEIMELYKKHKVNPMGSCLPLFLQMPVFFSLYQVLMRAVELRGAGFLWIKDLSEPDAAFSLPMTLPFIGNSVNALPILMMILTYVQQKTTSSGQMNEQQKTMAMITPVLLGVIFYNFPSGLALYFLINTIFSLLLQTFFFSKLNLVPEH